MLPGESQRDRRKWLNLQTVCATAGHTRSSISEGQPELCQVQKKSAKFAVHMQTAFFEKQSLLLLAVTYSAKPLS